MEKSKLMHTQWTENADSSPLAVWIFTQVQDPLPQDVPSPTPSPPLQSLTQTHLCHPNLTAFSYNKYPRAWNRAER